MQVKGVSGFTGDGSQGKLEVAVRQMLHEGIARIGWKADEKPEQLLIGSAGGLVLKVMPAADGALMLEVV